MSCRLQPRGTRFTQFTAGQPICTASRAALLTGCYPTRVGLSGVLLPTDHRALNPQETTVASLLNAPATAEQVRPTQSTPYCT